ncbi:MAG: hypothetical protein WCA89_16335 [Terracidiphilus sp.]|jgi:hypothetical protein
MASQEKHYIELSDILSLRFDCKHKQCGASFSLPLTQEKTQGIEKRLSNCPVCRREWAGKEDGANGTMIREFVEKLWKLKGQAQLADFNFRLYLELAQPPHLPSDAPLRIG